MQFFLTGFTTDLRDELQSVAVPALIVRGDHDLQAPLELCGHKTAQPLEGGDVAEALPVGPPGGSGFQFGHGGCHWSAPTVARP